MIMCEQDSDIFRWGLHQLLGDASVPGYCGTTTQNDGNIHGEVYVREVNCGTDHAAVENDEVIAHALQEEFSQVAVAESSGHPHGDEEHLQASVLAQDWFGPPMRNLYTGNEGGAQVGNDMEPSSSCPSPGEKLSDGEVLPLELTDEFSSLDGEVGKRLNHMVPVPHVPRINREIPSVDEATSDHQRLLDRLCLYDLVELKVQGDGNCQLKSNPDIYEGYVPMAYDDYLKKISKNGEWGDHVTLQAAADTYGVKIFVLTSFKDTCYIEILPNVQKSKRVIFLSFWAEVHYNSIYPEGDFPTTETKKKKREIFAEKAKLQCCVT
ncbi:uncharacterized protein LOC109837500 isoform X2 [Asparagus officinalis]|uniref:uncharacterized protein LOC109837500 isoform X2 n=1 Tax=Asparagus officinalis TaxID=4686 RepID=UPI00098E765D|nr:uncharacterized protein LOC109837500 isoform X2 [Asparagus officinalis]